MRLAVFDDYRLGVVRGAEMVDVTAILDPGERAWPPIFMQRLIADWERRSASIEALVQRADTPRRPLGEVRFQPPVPWPGKIVAAPVNYRAHQAELTAATGVYAGQAIRTVADYGLFLKPPSSLTGHDTEVILPFSARRTDHEAEIAVIIGRPVKNAAPSDALAAVFGYTALLDLTVRGAEDRPYRKGFDGFTPLGPWLVTADEVPDPGHWAFRLTVNGMLRQSGHTEDMIYDIAQLIALASYQSTLHPGDIIATGTPEGVGPVEPGDRVELHVDHVGTLAVTMAADPAPPEAALRPWAERFLRG